MANERPIVGIIHRTRSNTYYCLLRFLFEFPLLPLVAEGPINGYGAETGLWPNWPEIPLVGGDPISSNFILFAFALAFRV